jgi:alkylation response protein AidB-like acyl-CoA dehydrogenase
MDLRFTDEELAFREEVKAFIRGSLPEELRRKGLLGQRFSREDTVLWTRILHDRGWATPSWPREWGGPGWDAVRRYIFTEELYLASAPELLPFNVNMIGPTLIAFGSEEQKQHFLPGIARLDYWFCQGFSEPGAGSDLASLRTQALREGDHYIINGQKIWTTQGHLANWCFLLARTDPAAKKQEGITYLLLDMNTPGVIVQPIVSIDGRHEFNQLFLDNVRIPVSNRVGEENKGWTYAKYLLSHERNGVARVGLCKWRIQRAKEMAAHVQMGHGRLSDEPTFREQVAVLEVELKALEMLQMRVIAASTRLPSGVADPRSSILKIRGSELQQATAQLLVETAGYEAMEYSAEFLEGAKKQPGGEDWALAAAPNAYWLRHTTISGGTNEIQRDILAKSVLELS